MKKIAFLLVASAFILGNSSFLRAQTIVNGSFATGDFTGWTTLGSVQALTSGGPTPPIGTTQAYIQSTDEVSPGSSVSAATINSALSTSLPATFDTGTQFFGPGPFTAENGQAIYQSFTLGSTATLSFAYSFQSDDIYPFDNVGYVLDGVYTQLARPENPLIGGPTTPTDFTDVTLTLSSGSHTLGFVAYNTNVTPDPNDTQGSTGIYVTNVSVESVPEPSAWGLLLLSAVGLIVVSKVRSRFSPGQARA